MKKLHEPVLLEKVLDYLDPQPNQNFIDCTLGGGGHAEAILEEIKPRGKLLGIEWDPNTLKLTQEILKKFQDRLVLINDNFKNLNKIVNVQKFLDPINGVLFDLGLSSWQLQDPSKGFSFRLDSPLDMRFNPESSTLTAADILNKWPQENLTQILKEYGEERLARRIAKKIIEVRQKQKFKKTSDLVQIVLSIYPNYPKRNFRIHPATKTFQALRIAVNKELDNLKEALPQALKILKPGGRLAIISFHSLEDRIVKQFFLRESKDCLCPSQIPKCVCQHKAQLEILTPKPLRPSLVEIERNPRSRSAKLRIAQKI